MDDLDDEDADDQEDEINKHRFIYNAINDRYHLERDRLKILDDKSNNIISFVGIILGLQAGLGSFLLKEIPRTEACYQYLSSIFLLGIILLAISIFCGLLAYSVKSVLVVPDTGEELIELYGETDENFLTTLTNLSGEKAKAVRFNRDIGDRKVKFINMGFVLLVGGIIVNILFIYGLLIIRG